VGGYAGFNYPSVTQKERDFETGLDYFLARYYSSTRGRFLAADSFAGTVLGDNGVRVWSVTMGPGVGAGVYKSPTKAAVLWDSDFPNR
jgi:RHS repeat-associated protein